MSTTMLPAQFPRLETEKLILREITPADRQAIYENYSDPDNTRFIMQPLTRLEQADEIIQAFQEYYKKEQSVFWGVSLKGDDHLAGTISFENIQWEDQRAEIAYDLSKAYWGKGIMSEAIQAVLTHGFS